MVILNCIVLSLIHIGFDIIYYNVGSIQAVVVKTHALIAVNTFIDSIFIYTNS